MQQAMEYIDYTDQVQVDYSHLQKSKLKFKKGQRAKSVYHYTSIGGLESILRNKTLRFTNIKYMNDKDEIIAGLDSIAKDCNASDEVREQMRLAITNLGMQLFVCCFSLKEDSLPMWNYYTKEINSQGYNIEFDDKKLVESILRSNPVLDGCSFSFGNVDYSKDNDSEYSHILTNGLLSSMEVAISKIFLAVVTEMSKKQASGIDQSALRELEKKVSDSEREQKLDNLPVYVYQGEQCSFEKAALSDCLSFIKRDCFNQESEFRIVISVPDELLDKLSEMGVYKFRAGNGILIPYIELKFSENAVKSMRAAGQLRDTLQSRLRCKVIWLNQVFGIFCSIANITHLIFRILSNTPTSQFGFESQVDQISPEIKPLQ